MELTSFFGLSQSFAEVVNPSVMESTGQQTKTMARTPMQSQPSVTAKRKDRLQSPHPKTPLTLVPKIVLLNLKMPVASTNRGRDKISKIRVSLSFYLIYCFRPRRNNGKLKPELTTQPLRAAAKCLDVIQSCNAIQPAKQCCRAGSPPKSNLRGVKPACSKCRLLNEIASATSLCCASRIQCRLKQRNYGESVTSSLA